MPIVNYRGKKITFADDMTEAEISGQMLSIADQIDADLLTETEAAGSKETKSGLLDTVKDIAKAAVMKPVRDYLGAAQLTDNRSVTDNMDGAEAQETGFDKKAGGRALKEASAKKTESLKAGSKIVDGVSGVLEVGKNKGYAGIGRIESGLTRLAGDVLDSDTLRDAADDQAAYADEVADRAVLRGTKSTAFEPDSIAQDAPEVATDAIGSIITTGPALGVGVATGGATLPAMFATSALSEYGEGRESGLNLPGAATRAVGMGAAEVLGEKLGGTDKFADALTQVLGGKNKVAELGARMLTTGAKEIPSEEITTTAQFLLDKSELFGLNQDATLEDYIEQVKQTAKVAAFQGSTMAGAGGVIKAVADRTYADPLEAEAAQQNAESEAAIANITLPEISVDQAIELATKAVESPLAQPTGLLAQATPAQDEAIYAADILGDENADVTNDGLAGVVDGTIEGTSNNIQGSMGNILSEPVGTDTGSTEALIPSDTGDVLPGIADGQSDGALAIEQVIEGADGLPFAKDVAVAGEAIDNDWTAFNPETGTLGIPRAEMPQIKAEHRGAMVNFLNARDIQHTQEKVPASTLKPTQREFSNEKVRKAIDYKDGNRSILVSADDHVLDGHHQWLAKLNAGEDIDVIRLQAPIADLLQTVKEFPSATVDSGANGELKTSTLGTDAKAVLESGLSSTIGSGPIEVAKIGGKNSTETISVSRNGDTMDVLYNGEPLIDFETEQPVTLPTSASVDEIRKAVKGSGQFNKQVLTFDKTYVPPVASAVSPVAEPSKSPKAQLNAKFEANRDILRAWMPDMAWATEGGMLVRDEEGNASRTTWQPKDYDLDDIRRATGITFPGMQAAVQKALDGKPLNSKENRAIDALIEFAETIRNSNADAMAEESEAAGLTFEEENAFIQLEQDMDWMALAQSIAADDETLASISTKAQNQLDQFNNEVGEYLEQITQYERQNQGDVSQAQPGQPQEGNGSNGAARESESGQDAAGTVQITERRAAGNERLERRQDPDTRKKVTEMSADEMRRALLIDELTGIGNRRAYDEAVKKPYQVSIDADGLKWVNDNLGHQSGDVLLEAIGQAISRFTKEAYHISGDEYVVQADTEAEAAAVMDGINKLLAGAKVEGVNSNGDKVTLNGIGISYGIAKDLKDAEIRLQQHKSDRETSGQRAGRGQQPANATITSQRSENNQDNTTSETDLLGDNTATKQALANAERAKDAKRNSGADNSDSFTLTGSNSEADQAAAAGAQSLFDQPAITNPFDNGNSNTSSRDASWVIRNKETGEVILETFQKSVADKVNAEKYEAVPIGEYLASLNDNSSAKQWDGLSVGKRQKILQNYFGKDSDGPERYMDRSWADFNIGEKDSISTALRRYANKQAEPTDLTSESTPQSAIEAIKASDEIPTAEKIKLAADLRKGDITPADVNAIVGNEPLEPITGVASWKAFFDAVREGTVKAAEFSKAFSDVVGNKDAILAELNGMTKTAIFNEFPGVEYRYKNEKKERAVKAAYDAMTSRFTLGESFSWSYGQDVKDVIKSMVDKVTDEKLAAYASEFKAEAAERETRLAGMDNPQTLEDYTAILQEKMRQGKALKDARMELSPEQRAAYDELYAQRTMADRADRVERDQSTVRTAGQTVSGNIIETKHTKKGYDLFVVQLSDRVSKEDYNTLNAGAKRLGGYYSSFRGAGAVPGFQFTTRENAQAFSDLAGGNTDAAKEAIKERRNAFEDDRSQTAVERLTEMADRLEEKADEQLNADRKTNTSRRAGMAARAEAAANADKAMAITMRNIANAIQSGETKYLNKVRQKVQVELLQTIASNAQYEKLRKRYPAYQDYENNKGEPMDAETADYAEFPTYTAYRSDLASLGRSMASVPGLKKLSERLMSVADDVTDIYLKFAKENIGAVGAFRTSGGQLAAYSSKALAEEAIGRNGFKGQAIVLPFKRGENILILSPAEAMKRGIWQGDNDKRITLSAEFGKELVEKLGRANRKANQVTVPWQFESAYERREKLKRMNIENAPELRAALREFIGLRETAKAPDKIKEMERKMIGRKNDGLDFFPTPARTSDEMIEAADIQEGMTILEPSAGMGHIADRIREAGHEPDVVEFSGDRRELLETKGYNVVASDFMDVTEKYDRIIMNPPFSNRRDEEHVRHAYGLLKPNGKLVAIMGEGVFFGSDKRATEFRDWLESVGGTSEKLEEGTFLDASLPVNTGVNARMVVIEKGETEVAAFSRNQPTFYSALTRAIEAIQTKKADPAMWKGMIKNLAQKGVKPDEIEWTGVNEWLDMQSGAVTKDQVLEYLSGNGVEVTETMLGGSDFARQTPNQIGHEAIKDYANQMGYLFDDRGPDGYSYLIDPEENETIYEGFVEDIINAADLDIDFEIEEEGDTKYSQYTVPGGENYKELLLTLPINDNEEIEAKAKLAEFQNRMTEKYGEKWKQEIDGDEDTELDNLLDAKNKANAKTQGYKSSHFDQANILAHVRFDERTDADGNKVLFIQEIQSDWAQQGKKSGFKSDAENRISELDAQHKKLMDIIGENNELFNKFRKDNNFDASEMSTAMDSFLKTKDGKDRQNVLDEMRAIERQISDIRFNDRNRVPAAPFVTKTDAWVSLALKRMMRYAAENGFDKVAIISGQQAADLYDLSKNISRVNAVKDFDGKTYTIGAFDNSGREVMQRQDVEEDKLADFVGKDLAEKIVAMKNGEGKQFQGLDLKVGGEGMRTFYDSIVPKVAKDVLKKLGGQVEGVSLNGAATYEQLVAAGEATGISQSELDAMPVSERKALVDSKLPKQISFTITDAMRDQIMQGLPLFAKSNQSVGKLKPMAFRDVQKTVNNIRSKWNNAPDIIIVNDMTDPAIPAPVRDENERQLSQGATGQPEGFYVGGKVYVVASEMGSPDDVMRVVFHETLGHYGLRKTYGSELNKILDEVYMARRSEVVAKAKAYGLDYTAQGDRRAAAEEVLAEMAQSNPQSGIVQRALAAIRKFLRDIGFDIELSDNDIVVNYLLPARQFVERVGKEQSVRDMVGAFARRNVTETEAFKRWFGDSKVVDKDGKPLVVYHGTKADFDAFSADSIGTNFGLDKDGFFFTSDAENASEFASGREWQDKNGSNLMPTYLSITNPLTLEEYTDLYYTTPSIAILQEGISVTDYFDDNRKNIIATAKERGNDGVIFKYSDEDIYVALKPSQIKSAIGNNGDFDPDNSDIRFSRSPQSNLQPQWQTLQESKMDDAVRVLQDKNIDLKRVIQGIKAVGNDIEERWNAYLQEELYHGRTAKRAQDFIKNDLEPLLEDMRMRGVAMADFEEYLWMRHAEERNIQIAKINPGLPDGGSGVETAEAQAYLANLTGPDKAKYEALAKRVDLINRKSRQVLIDYGLESSDTISAWESAYEFYVPLMREDMERGFGNGTGQGFSIKGSSTKRATGSNRAVVDIIANIAQQYEKNIIRGEKNRVATALIGLAKLNPNPDFWKVDTPPTIKTINKATGLVETITDPMYKTRDSVVVARIRNKLGKIEERSVVFNEFDERAMSLAKSIKNLDQDDLGKFLGVASIFTRWIASVNTQYNPVFGFLNIIRDAGGVMLNLSTTPIKGKQADVLRNAFPAIKGIYQDLRAQRKGGNANNAMVALFEEFQSEGGQTGYRDMFANAKDRSEALRKALDPTWWQNSKLGKIISVNGAIASQEQWLADKAITPLFDWLSDFNTTLENAMRLSTYQVALENGESKQAAASLAKNISVNFNRKGNIGRQMGALFAFFNASVQGTARIGETLAGPAGKRIIGGGLLLGVMQALALAAAGYDDDEPPEFVKNRNIVIPLDWLDGVIGTDDKYVTIPMPLGFNAIPSVGRIVTEFAMAGGNDPQEHLLRIISMVMDVTNPVGGSGSVANMITPTVGDPFVDLYANKDWTGRDISREDFSSLKPTPGFTRSRDVSWDVSVGIAQAINAVSGGTDYTPGYFSPTADEIEYLVGQFTGGVGRETIKAGTTIESMVTGEDLPAYKIPLLGRFYGDASGQASQAGKFYSNIRELNLHKAEIDGLRKSGGDVKAYRAENPESALAGQAAVVYREVAKLRKRQNAMQEAGADRAKVQVIEDQITNVMKKFNERVIARKEKEAAI